MIRTEIVPTVDVLPVDKAIRETEVLVSVGVVIGALEALSRPETYDEGGLLSWRVNKTKFPKFARSRAAKIVDPIFTAPGVHIVLALRITAAALVACPGTDRRVKTA